MSDFKFEVGETVKDITTGKIFVIKERWKAKRKNFYEDSNDSTHFEKNLLRIITIESISGTAEKLMQPIMDKVKEIEKLLGITEQEEELEQILTNADKEKDFKVKQYDKILDTMFMACGMVEDGDSIKYIIDPETIINEILKIILNDNQDRDKFVVKKRDAIQAIKAGDEW